MPLPTCTTHDDNDSPPPLREEPFPGFRFPILFWSDHGGHFVGPWSDHGGHFGSDVPNIGQCGQAAVLTSLREVYANDMFYEMYWHNWSVQEGQNGQEGKEPTELEEVD